MLAEIDAAKVLGSTSRVVVTTKELGGTQAESVWTTATEFRQSVPDAAAKDAMDWPFKQRV